MSTADNPRANQVNAYFGLGGLESLDGGFRGRITYVTGLLFGTSAVALANAEATFRSYNDGIARPLVDQLGNTWPNVRLEWFHPSSRISQTPGGWYYRSYQARFLHLT
ncbi:MAG: hypothetical protein NVSMB14_18010 [Isosphaeraceae bacterium]